MEIRKERIPLLWSTVQETAMAKGFSFNIGDTKRDCDGCQNGGNPIALEHSNRTLCLLKVQTLWHKPLQQHDSPKHKVWHKPLLQQGVA